MYIFTKNTFIDFELWIIHSFKKMFFQQFCTNFKIVQLFSKGKNQFLNLYLQPTKYFTNMSYSFLNIRQIS